MANTIKIKRSNSTATPGSLAEGELANSESTAGGTNELFIGLTTAAVHKLVSNTNGAAAQPTAGLSGATPVTGDYIVFEDVTDSLPKRNLFSATPLSIFNNDSGFARLSQNETVTGSWTLDGVVTTSDFGTGGAVKDGTDVSRPVGFNTMPVYEINTADAFDLAHNGMIWYKSSGVAVTFTANSDATIPQGATYVVHNADTEDVTIASGTATVYWLEGGSAPASGNVIVGEGGIVTVYKYSDTIFWVWGSKAAGSVVASINDLTDVTITSAATGDILRYNGSAWVDYPDSNYAASSHTHTEDQIQLSTNNRIVGRLTAGAGGGEELTGTQVTTLIDLFATAATTKGLVPGSNSLGSGYYLDGSGTWSVPSGSGDVAFNGGTAPADNALVRFDGVTGQVIQESGIIISDAEAITGVATINGKNPSNMVVTTDASTSGWSFVIDEDAMGSNSDTKVPTQQSVKAYVDNAVTGALTHKGGYNASTNTPALDTGSPVLSVGDMYTVTVAGTFFTVALEVGDVLIADVDSVDAASVADWTIVQSNIGYASETVSGYIEIATQAEVDAAASAVLAVVPSYLHATTFDGGTF